MKKEVKEWVTYAKEDYTTAKYLFAGDKRKEACFFLQQSVEKILKALMLETTGKVVKTHDLVFLAREVGLPSRFNNVCSELSVLYIVVRYPSLESEVKVLKSKMKQYFSLAGSVLEWTQKQLQS